MLLQKKTSSIASTNGQTNGIVCTERRGLHWRRAFDCRIIFKIWVTLFHKQSHYLIARHSNQRTRNLRRLLLPHTQPNFTKFPLNYFQNLYKIFSKFLIYFNFEKSLAVNTLEHTQICTTPNRTKWCGANLYITANVCPMMQVCSWSDMRGTEQNFI